MQINLYDYLEKKMAKDVWQSEWRVIEDERLQEVTVQLFLPLKDILTEKELANFEEHLDEEVSSYLIQAQFNPVVTGEANIDGYYYFSPRMYEGGLTKTNIDVILECLHQLEISATSQLRDIANGRSKALSLAWPSRFEASRLQALRTAGRFESISIKGIG